VNDAEERYRTVCVLVLFFNGVTVPNICCVDRNVNVYSFTVVSAILGLIVVYYGHFSRTCLLVGGRPVTFSTANSDCTVPNVNKGSRRIVS